MSGTRELTLTDTSLTLNMTGIAIDLANNTISNVADPTTASMVGDRGYNDSRYRL